jgi:hypothetical protein
MTDAKAGNNDNKQQISFDWMAACWMGMLPGEAFDQG